MRIIRGKLKTKRVTVPKSFPSRPTTDFAKEGLFNMLENRMDFSNLRILDLCAGTGNISFEFISREAGTVTAVDSNFNCVRHIRNLAKSFEIEKEIAVVQSDIIKLLGSTEAKYDIIFTDPPYEFPKYDEIVNLVFERDLLNEEGVLIIEHGKRTDLSVLPHFELARTYGNIVFSFFEK